MGALQYSLFVLVLVEATVALSGYYVPRSFYIIDRNGHQSDVVSLRNKRASDVLLPLMRARRSEGSGAQASASASASAQSSAGSHGPDNFAFYGGFPGSDFSFPDVQRLADPNYHAEVLQNLASRSGFPGGAPGIPTGIPGVPSGTSGSFSGSTKGGSGSGYGFSTGGTAGPASGSYDGPILFSRSGEAPGSTVEASGYASGPRGAFSSSSTSSENGKVKYSVQSGKY